MKLKTLIINRNRLKLAVDIANWCSDHGLEPIFIDNGSDSPMLIQYYAELCPYQVVHLGANYGHTCIWLPELDLLNKLGIINERYIVTDPDLDLSGVPDDFLQVMNKGLDKYEVDKCGLSLEINDLPNSDEGNYIRYKCEAKYWMTSLDAMYFKADTDTTFALYREGVNHYSHSAVRTNRPYTARHIPWYYTDFNLLSDDEQYYFRTASDSSSGKKRLIK